MPTRCIDCSTVSAIARMPVARAATDGMRHRFCNRSVKVRACGPTYRPNLVIVISDRLVETPDIEIVHRPVQIPRIHLVRQPRFETHSGRESPRRGPRWL